MAIEWRWGDPGWGFSHTPLYIPDFRDEDDVFQHITGHIITGAGLSVAARLYAGSWPAGGYLAQFYRALLSPAHIGSVTSGTNAFADTMYALRVYSTPFQYLASAAAIPVAAGIGIASAIELHQDSSTLDMTRSLGGGYTGGSTRTKKIASLGGF